MKAILYTEYGLPDVFQLKEVAQSTPKDDEVRNVVQKIKKMREITAVL